MIAIIGDLWIGSEADYDQWREQPDRSYVLAARDPWHRAMLGYTGRSAPIDSPDYLYVEREHLLVLNLVDADSITYIDERVIEKAMAFMSAEFGQFRQLACFCNKGESRSPTIALLWLHRTGWFADGESYDDAARWLNARMSGTYKPNGGMKAFAVEHWT